ncbi:hypothetical protein MWU60_19410 [Yoonia sp. F2084L]|uniref:hypothetical protein n=1 Tax=Yoonia sp. F2084L TaxID=2926419 RepID=UPI001FF559CB|nr:hypothetical protein [Yoonia sp. F2084L]MCK0097750.1 hypothetical protein [Yoonia sp. F2084L]
MTMAISRLSTSLSIFQKKESIDLGSVKIVEVDQTGGYTDMPRKPFTQLDEGFASLGADLDYYETLYKLGREVFEPYLSALHDIAYDDDAKALVEDTEGYRVSLLRFSGAKRTITDAARLLQAPKRPSPRRRRGFMMKFKTRASDFSNSFTVDFDFRRIGRLPNRINALIGYNGTGKTRLLNRAGFAGG